MCVILSSINDCIHEVTTLNLVCLASGKGSNVRALAQAIEEEAIHARIALIISNNSGAGVIEFARSAHIPWLHLSEKQFTTHDEYARAIAGALHQADADIIVLAGFMKKLPDEICRHYAGRILNIHPALLPAFGGTGMYGMKVHEAVLASGVRESGATVHLVDEEYDHGKIVMQESVPVMPGDTPEILAARVLDCEHRLLPRAVARLVEQIERQSNKIVSHE